MCVGGRCAGVCVCVSGSVFDSCTVVLLNSLSVGNVFSSSDWIFDADVNKCGGSHDKHV